MSQSRPRERMPTTSSYTSVGISGRLRRASDRRMISARVRVAGGSYVVVGSRLTPGRFVVDGIFQDGPNPYARAEKTAPLIGRRGVGDRAAGAATGRSAG